MKPPMVSRRSPRQGPFHGQQIHKGGMSGDMLRLTFVLAAYYVALVAGLRLQLGFSQIPVIWPANAILVSALLLTPKGRWWLYLLGVIPAHITAYGIPSVGVDWVAIQIIHNSALAVVTALVVRRLSRSSSGFEQVRWTTAFLVAAMAVPGLFAILTVTILSTAMTNEAIIRYGWTENWWTIASGLWLGNSVSMLAFVPAILVWATRGRMFLRTSSRRHLLEFALSVLALVLVSFILFTRTFIPLYLQPALLLVPTPLLFWVAFRFQTLGAATVLVVIVCISAWGAWRRPVPGASAS